MAVDSSTTGRPPRLAPGRLFALAPYALLAGAALFAAPALLGGWPCEPEALAHLLRAAQVSVLVEDGAPFLQWAPEMFSGYGHPAPALAAPLTAWLALGLHGLGFALSAALRVLALLGLVAAGCGMYAYARRWLSTPASLAAALSFQFSPYLLDAATRRAAVPEVLALGLLPLGLALLDRAQARRAPADIALAAAAAAFVVLFDFQVALVGAGLALVSSVLRALQPGEEGAARGPLAAALAFRPPLAALLLALALAAFAWWPALAEHSFTQSAAAAGLTTSAPGPSPAGPDRLPAGLWLAWPPGLGAASLGPVQATLALAAGLTLFSRRMRHRGPLVAAWGAALLLYLILAGQPALSLWQRWGALVPRDLPGRFLGGASLAAALLGGVAVAALADLTAPRWFVPAGAALAAGLVLGAGRPWLSAEYCATGEPYDRPALLQAMGSADQASVLANDRLPRWVEAWPDMTTLLPAYQERRPVNRLKVPYPNAEILRWEPAPAHDVYRVRLSEPLSLTYHAFYFPGWTARLNGQMLPLSPSTPEGLITLEVPAGEHVLEIRFERTPVRRTTAFISLGAALIWLELLLGAARRARSAAPAGVPLPAADLPATPAR